MFETSRPADRQLAESLLTGGVKKTKKRIPIKTATKKHVIGFM